MVRHIQSSKPNNVFTVELWVDDGSCPVEQLASAGNFYLAKAAFDEATRRMPGRFILVQHGISVVLETR